MDFKVFLSFFFVAGEFIIELFEGEKKKCEVKKDF